jgi:hypothetical protein
MMRRSWRTRIKSRRAEVRVMAKVEVVVEKGSCLLIGCLRSVVLPLQSASYKCQALSCKRSTKNDPFVCLLGRKLAAKFRADH